MKLGLFSRILGLDYGGRDRLKQQPVVTRSAVVPDLPQDTQPFSFVVIDVETANADLASICQVGVVGFRDGAVCREWKCLVNPEDDFDPINVSIHGIDETLVRDAPTWLDLYPIVRTLLQDNIVVCHTHFDRVALARACERNALPACTCQWLDSAKVVRRAWPVFSRSGYGLANVAAHFGIQYVAHDALEDARCAGEIVVRAIAETGIPVEQWLTRVEQPIGLSNSDGDTIKRAANPEGPLLGEVLVFTGSLSLPRHVAAEIASTAGCRVEESVTKRTTLLVVGDQDLRKLNGHDKSSKQRKAEELISQGQHLRILSESDFQRIIQHSGAATDMTARVGG